MQTIRLGMAQINSTVGDFAGNQQIIIRQINKAKEAGCDIVVFPELCITGYPPEDLLFKSQFIRENKMSLKAIIPATSGITAIIGFVDGEGSSLFNSAAVIANQSIVTIYHKIILPNYGVFDEQRYFKPGNDCSIVNISGVGTGINICEDIWFQDGPAVIQSSNGAALIINISSSPFHSGKLQEREIMLAKRAQDLQVIVAYVNQVGGQDELVFDGGSVVIGIDGCPIARAPQFEEGLFMVDINMATVIEARREYFKQKQLPTDLNTYGWQSNKYTVIESPQKFKKTTIPLPIAQPLKPLAEIYQALVLGTRDYVNKNCFKHAVIGISGGIDSSLVAAIAVDALEKENVTGVAMPSQYSSQESFEDAKQLCENLGIRLINIPINRIYDAYLETLSDVFKNIPHDKTEENIQARIRGNILMALSNKFGWLVLTTGNKSEMATGYTTLYGDVAGGVAVIKDVPKTLVYEIGLYSNSRSEYKPIPETILAKAPTAELRHNQKDSDSLPAYDILDPILNAYVEQDEAVSEIIAKGFDESIVKHMARLVDTSEYKRRQAPPGIKITSRAFGRDRRLPITNRFRGV